MKLKRHPVGLYKREFIITNGEKHYIIYKGGNVLKRMLFVTALVIGLLSVSYAQENNVKKFVGVWVGVIDAGGQTMTVIFKIQEKDGKLSGTAESPERGGETIPLENLVVSGNKIQFELTPVQGGFDGVYKEDTKKIDGTLVVNQQGIPLLLAKDEKAAPAENAPAAAEKVAAPAERKYESFWEGTLETSGGNLRIVLKIYKNADGKLCAVADSPDQGAKDLPITTVTLTEDALNFEATDIGAVYTGKIDKATMTAKGKFTQGGMEFDLNMKKVDKPSEK
jgi:hypothetical protein